MSSHFIKMYRRWPAFPTYAVFLGCISGQPCLVSPSFLDSSVPPLLPLRTTQFQALPTSAGPRTLDRCAGPSPTNGPRNPWCKINATQGRTFGCFLDSLFSYKYSQWSTLQLGWSSVPTLQPFGTRKLLVASFLSSGWPLPDQNEGFLGFWTWKRAARMPDFRRQFGIY